MHLCPIANKPLSRPLSPAISTDQQTYTKFAATYCFIFCASSSRYSRQSDGQAATRSTVATQDDMTSTDHLTIRGSKGQGAGRSLHTTRAYRPGDLVAIFTDPLLVLPNGPSAKSVCNHCLAHSLPTKACTGCKAVAYCGPACQKANWALIHKLECKVFRKVKASVDKDWLPTPVRATVQVLLRWDTDDGVKDGFGRLEGNVDGFKKREDVWKDVGLQAFGAMKYAGRKETDDQLHMARDILCKVSIQRDE